MKKYLTWLNDKKSYIVAVATIAYALSGAFLGKMNWEEAVLIAFGAAGFGAGAHKVQKVLDALRQLKRVK